MLQTEDMQKSGIAPSTLLALYSRQMLVLRLLQQVAVIIIPFNDCIKNKEFIANASQKQHSSLPLSRCPSYRLPLGEARQLHVVGGRQARQPQQETQEGLQPRRRLAHLSCCGVETERVPRISSKSPVSTEERGSSQERAIL